MRLWGLGTWGFVCPAWVSLQHLPCQRKLWLSTTLGGCFAVCFLNYYLFNIF